MGENRPDPVPAAHMSGCLMKTPLLAALVFTAACAREGAPPTAVAVAEVNALANGRDDDDRQVGTVVTFEGFFAGAIGGQFDWKSLGGVGAPPPADPADTHCAVYDHQITQNPNKAPYKSFDNRSLRISNAVTSGCYGDHTFSSRVPDPAGQAGSTSRSANGLVEYSLPGGTLRNHFEAEWSFASTVPDALQSGLEVVVSPARGDSHRMSWVQMADLADGLAVTFAERSNPANPGAITQITVARQLDRRKTHTIKLVMDFLDGPGNDVVRIYVNGDPMYTGASWETYYLLEPGGASQFGGNPPAVNRLMFRTGSDVHRGIPGTPAPATLGKGLVIDNLRTATFSVPRTTNDCANGGWLALRDTDGTAFKKQSDCENSLKPGQSDDDR